MSSDTSFNDDFEETFSEEGDNTFNVLDSIVFLVDGTKQMFEKDCFTKCLEVYRNIIRQKCAYNKKDRVGLVVFGTEQTNCEVDNLMQVQKFETVTVDSLININNILKGNVDEYKEMSGSKYSLYDALFYAYRITESFKTNSKKHNMIFLCTCNDNPCHENNDEQRRIQHLVATFKDSETKLWVAGLSDSWDDKLYYRDLQIISGTFSNDDYRRINLSDVEQNIISPCRSIGKLTWKISPQIAIDVNLMNVIATPNYPSKVKLEKKDNEILEDRQVLREDNIDDYESIDLTEGRKEKKIIKNQNLEYSKSFCNTNVRFTPAEHKKFQNMGLESGINILAFKPAICQPINHVTHPYFITCTPNSNHESKTFFMAFLNRCAQKKVMAICNVVTNTNIFLCSMFPSDDDGGFYMYKIPFSDMCRNLDDVLSSFIYNIQYPCPTNDKAVQIFHKLIEICKEDFDIRKFTNPKLEKCIAHIEALALDEKLSELPPDTTLPPTIIDNDVQNLKKSLIDLLESLDGGPTKRPANRAGPSVIKKARLDIVTLAVNKQLQKATVAELRSYLNSVHQGSSGSKSELIKKVNDYLGI